MGEHRFHTPLPLVLDVSIPAGSINVETVDGDESTIFVTGDERLVEDVEVRHDGNRLVVAFRGKRRLGGLMISVGSFNFGGDAGLRVRALVPHGTSAELSSVSADVSVDGRLQALEAKTTSGDLRACGEIAGDATVKPISGDAELDGVGGNIKLQTVSGDALVRSVGGKAELKSISGDLRLDALASGDVHFSSVSGDVEIGVAAGSLLDVDAGSTSGDLSSEVPLASEPIACEGANGPMVVVRGRTISGDVRVFRAA